MSRQDPTLNRIDPQLLSAETTVCHFDELDDDAKDVLLALLEERSSATPDRADVERLSGCDVVKYIDYYDVDLAGSRAVE